MLSGFFQFLQLIRIGFVLAREGAFSLVDPAPLPPSARMVLKVCRIVERRRTRDGAAGLAAAMARLGPSYVKFGQFLATRPDIVGTAAARNLESLQDQMAPFPRARAVKIIEENLGRPIDELFASFSEPVAAASIAQVHKAVIRSADGSEETVAVKVIRPNVRDRFARDLQSMRYAAGLMERFLPDGQRLKPREVVETLARSVTLEMDLRLEAAAISELVENTKDDQDFRIPDLYWTYTDRDILTIEWIDAIRLNDLDAIDRAGIDRPTLAKTVLQAFLKHAIRDGFFHADMHPGNLFVDHQSRLVAVDFGIMGRLSFAQRRFLAEILLGFINRDYHRVAEVHFAAGYVPSSHSIDDFAQAIRAVGEPIHDRRANEISMARLLTLLFEITALFDMATRPELVMLQKTMVVVEGVARMLDPKLDMWTTADPVVRTWIERNLGPVGQLEEAGRNLHALVDMVRDLPNIAKRADNILGKLEKAIETDEFCQRQSARKRGTGLWATLALWVIAVAMILIVV
ncbi:2-polyprenylphenol 6-hydroxylase [Microvirga sp. W0021]|uniref:2-polyprenylphenol 6-hydroxylase n=1 Tax=Hohaiivirga grylli TaxID=3133970 RepID=A0ABV0BIR3_9HYPH